MRELANSYYYFLKDDPDGRIPIIFPWESRGYLFAPDLLDNIVPVQYTFKMPPPKKTILGDFFEIEPIFSKRVTTVFEELADPLFQFVPIKLPMQALSLKIKEEDYPEYIFFRCCRKNNVIDKKASEFTTSKDDPDSISVMEKFIFDEEKLKKIPLEERLIFYPKSHGRIVLHKSIVDKIMALDPVGIKFVKVEKYTDSMMFD